MKHLRHGTTEELRFQQKEHSETTTDSKHMTMRSAIQSLRPQEAMGALERRLLQINKDKALAKFTFKTEQQSIIFRMTLLEWKMM